MIVIFEKEQVQAMLNYTTALKKSFTTQANLSELVSELNDIEKIKEQNLNNGVWCLEQATYLMELNSQLENGINNAIEPKDHEND